MVRSNFLFDTRKTYYNTISILVLILFLSIENTSVVMTIQVFSGFEKEKNYKGGQPMLIQPTGDA